MPDDVPTFPQYPPPQTGLQIAPPSVYRPLKKMMNHLLKPPAKRDPFHGRRPRTRMKVKKVKYY